MNLDIFRDAAKLDPLDLFPNSSYEPMWVNYELTMRRSRFKNVQFFPRLTRFAVFFINLFWNLFRRSPKSSIQRQKHLMFALTRNQVAAIEPVLAGINNENSDSAVLISSAEMNWTTARSFFYAIPFLFHVVVRALREKGHRGRSFRWALDEYWRTYGLYVVVRRWLRQCDAKTVTVSNDHSLLPCVIVKAAQDEGVDTFYIQHACVTNRFPPLRVDYALLDGLDAHEKYSVVDQNRTTVCLIGVPKFDAYADDINHSETANSIGVCFSLADKTDRCLELLNGLASLGSTKISVRPHMGMEASQKQAFKEACEKHNYSFSSHADEPSFEFLKKNDILISGSSAIALEAVMLNVTSLNFVLNPESPDWYGFVEQGLTKSTDQIDELLGWISALTVRRPPVRHLANRYSASIGSPLDSQSSKVAADFIGSSGQSRTYLAPIGEGLLSVSTESKKVT